MSLKNIIIGIVIFIVALILLGFALVTITTREMSSPGFVGAPSVGEDMASDYGRGVPPKVPTITPSPSLAESTKKVITQASLQLVVENTDWSVQKMSEIAQQHKGFVESSQINTTTQGSKQGWLTIRVPSDQFTQVFEAVKGIAQIIEVERISGQDVTQQYVDMEARLKNLRATEGQYLDILRRAQTIEDILRVQQLLSQVRSDIESMEAQLKYLSSQVELATITVNLSQEPSIALSLQDFRPMDAIKASLQLLLRGLILLFNVLVSIIVVVIPLALIALALMWILWKIITKIKNRYSR